MTDIAKKVKTKSCVLEILNELMSTLDYRERDTKTEYTRVGEEEYTDSKGETRTRGKYEDAPKENLSEEDKCKLEAIGIIRNALIKLV